MRRFIAVFSLSIFIFIHFLSFQPVSAVSSVDYGEMLNYYLGVSELGLAITQGANIDFSAIEYPEEIDTDQEKAKYLVNYFSAIRHTGVQAIYNWMFENDNPSNINSAAIGLSTTSGIGASGTQDIKEQLNNVLALHNGKHIIQRYNDSIIARWNNYNVNYINDYLDSVPGPEEIEYPDLENNISLGSVHINNSDVDFSSYGYYDSFNAYINGTAYYNLKYPFAVRVNNNGTYYYYIVGYNLYPGNNNVYSTSGYWSGVTDPTYFPDFSSFIYPYFEDLSTAINFSNTGTIAISGGLTVTIPDAVIDSGTDDGKIAAHPIYYPDTVDQGGSIDIDLDKLSDLVISKIANNDTTIDQDDLIGAGVFIDADGNTLTDADTKTKDVSTAITRAKAVDIDVPLWDGLPPLPKLPPVDPGDPGSSGSNSGFAGMSVLARIINFTVQSLPATLIVVFFGVVFGVIILGIIKILHH